MEEIEVQNLTKDYGHGRGIFDVSFSVHKGEVFGFLGPNGAGKSTVMRHLMGFGKPQNGNAYIGGKECFAGHSGIMRRVGYLPGEPALPEGLRGDEFLHMMRGMRAPVLADRTQELLQTFRIDPHAPVKRLSIGEKRKLAVVAAFMSDPDVLLLDEPTSGLDPVMQEVFIDFVRNEKARGKTVLLSSHLFGEVEALCDRIAIIKEGRIVSVVSADEVKHYKRKTFVVAFSSPREYERFLGEPFDFRVKDEANATAEVAAEDGQSDLLIKTLARYSVAKITEHRQTLEEYFMHFYKSERVFGGLKK